MGERGCISGAEKERIYQGKLAGKTIRGLAAEIGCSEATVRKWWRVGRKHGQEGLRAPRHRRGKRGHLSRFAPQVAEQAKELKHQHPGWGADRVRIEMEHQEQLQDVLLPGRSSLAAFFKARCPEDVGKHEPRDHTPPVLQATGVHEVWQVDHQEDIRLGIEEWATVCNIRDPYGAAMIASQAFATGTGSASRKLRWTEVQAVLRQGFTEWHTLPDTVQTDHEMAYDGNAEEPLPGPLMLWLVGLGIRHHLIRPHRPTDQAHIERNHRTLDGWTFDPLTLRDLPHLQQALDASRFCYNHEFPARASNCQHQPPLIAHPDLLMPRRPYTPQLELALFDIQRVYDFLATFQVHRKPSRWGQFTLMAQCYSLGTKPMRDLSLKTILVRFDPTDLQWVCSTDPPHSVELLRLPIKGLDIVSLTGLLPQPIVLPHPIQLPLPFWLCETTATISSGL